MPSFVLLNQNTTILFILKSGVVHFKVIVYILLKKNIKRKKKKEIVLATKEPLFKTNNRRTVQNH